MSVRCVCGQSTHLKSVQFLIDTLKINADVKKPSLSCSCTRGLLSDAGSFFLAGQKMWEVFLTSLMEILASRLAWLNCRRFLAGAILLEQGCVVLGVRFSSAMHLHGVAFEAWALP